VREQRQRGRLGVLTFADYLAYRNTFATLGQDVHEFDVTRRHVFTVTNQSGYPLLGAHIVISTSGNSNSGGTVADLLTDSSGRALWFPQNSSANANSSFKAAVSNGGATAHVSIDPTSSVYQVTLDAPATTAPVPLDIEFVVDATGSMGDEIAQLKASLSDIAARIDALPAKPDVRFALTIYRDRVDSFLTRTWNFTPDLAGFEREIAGVTADGGGDDPEDVQQGLYDALHKPAWRADGAAKLMLLIGDARPRHPTPQKANGDASAAEAPAPPQPRQPLPRGLGQLSRTPNHLSAAGRRALRTPRRPARRGDR